MSISLSYNLKIAIFDLDMTLWDGVQLYRDVKPILNMLRANGVKLYIASFNEEAKACCEYLDIDHLFEEILYGPNKTKLEMIRHVIKANQQIKEYEMAFFDDDQSNLHEVKMATNVHTIHIDEYGLNFTHIGNMFSIDSGGSADFVIPDLDMFKLV